MGKDVETLTCHPDLHRAGAHLRQPLQADAVLHRAGGGAVPGRGEAAPCHGGGFTGFNLVSHKCPCWWQESNSPSLLCATALCSARAELRGSGGGADGSVLLSLCPPFRLSMKIPPTSTP